MRRVIGMDIHRTFAEVVIWEAGRLRPVGRVDMTRSGLEGFGRSLNKEDEVVVSFDGRDVKYGLEDLEALTRAYAITIHKSQGSEYPAVVIPLLRDHAIMLARNLLYTAATRGRQLVVLVAEPRALEMALSGDRIRRRFTRLKSMLTG